MRLLSLDAEQRSIQLTLQCDEDVPRLVFADAGKLQQILTNIVANGIKFTDQGYVAVSVSSQPMEGAQNAHTHRLAFTVQDTGIGIATHEIARLFVPFEQAAAGRAIRKGTGLGLSISQQYCQLMGGEISVSSVLSKGSCFGFTIPVQQKQSLSTDHPQESRKESVLAANIATDTEVTEEGNAILDDSELLTQLCTMPTEWLSKLLTAAEQIRGKQVLYLIDQLPLTQAKLAQRLRYWAETYQFEKIVEMLESRLQ